MSRIFNYSVSLFMILAFENLYAQPDLSPKTVQAILGNVLSVSRDPASDGSELMDTVAGTSSYESSYISAIRYPGAVETVIDRRVNSWTGNTANVAYTWQCLLMKAKISTATAFVAEEAKLVDAINQTMPGIQPDSTKTWTTKEGTRVSLIRRVQSQYKTDDQLLIHVYVNKKVTGNKQVNIEHILAKYTAAIAITNSTAALTAYCKTAFFKIYSEGLSYQEAATTVLPLFQATISKNLRAGYNVFSKTPGDATPIFAASLSATQKKGINDIAQGIIDNFYATENGTATTATAANTAAPPRQPGIIAYNQLYKDTISKKYVYIISFNEITGMYKMQDCYWVPKDKFNGPKLNKVVVEGEVSESYFSSRNWVAVSAGACYSCNGKGITFTSTPYSYNYTEKGIYNTYTYSGTGNNVTKHVCTGCGGTGFSEYYLR